MPIINPALDASGNGNNWTPININYFTSGVTYDTMTDVPTLTSATASNFCVWNEIDPNREVYTNGNLSLSGGLTLTRLAKGTIASSLGKFYWEYTITSTSSTFFLVGIAGLSATASGGGANSGNSVFYRHDNGDKVINGTSSSYGASWTTGDVIGVALDLDANTVVFYKNNSSQGSISITADTYTPAVITNQPSHQLALNCGQRPFAYTPPTGFVALNTFNLPTPTIGATASTQANKYMDATLYTGNGSTQSIVNAAGFSPDLVWVKQRNGTGWNILTDIVRGANKQLYTNSTLAEGSDTSMITALNSNGFSVAYNGGTDVNGNGSSYVAWQWDAGGAGVTNTAGSITSTVSANQTSGFSIVTYTGNGSSGATIGHGLGVAPRMVIVQTRTGTNNKDKPVYHASIGNTGAVILNKTIATDTWSGYWNNTSPSSTVVTLGNDQNTNQNGSTYVAYCFSQVAGYSAFGSYTGNGSTNGPFVYLGFRPKYLMIKAFSSGSVERWLVYDSARDTFNAISKDLVPNTDAAEAGAGTMGDLLSNGFKITSVSSSAYNLNGYSYIYAAFAEFPFKYANAR
jgi:hypothetical protein